MTDLLSDLDNQDYDASSIEILEGLEPPRRYFQTQNRLQREQDLSLTSNLTQKLLNNR